jgi:4-amino-4-deoxy-L-arabinose transferase-like glycosyltransferase
MMKRLRPILPFILLFFIILVGAYLRFYRLSEYMTFLGDEGRDALTVKRMIVDGKWTLLGPTASVGGFFMGPVYYYFMAPFLWLWKLDPVGPAVMVALVGTATIGLVYLVGRTLFGTTVGLVSSSLYAISPFIIAYSRSSWNPNIVPFFTLLAFFILWVTAETKKWGYLFFLGFILGIDLQLHYTVLFAIAAATVFIFLYRARGLKPANILMGLFGFIIGFSPFLAFELRHGFTIADLSSPLYLKGRTRVFPFLLF